MTEESVRFVTRRGWGAGWGDWWQDRRLRYRLFPFLAVGLYWLLLATLAGEVKLDQVVYGATVLLLAYAGPVGQRVLWFLLPFILTGALYDSQRYWGETVRGVPNIAEPYLLERALFGIPTAGGTLTLNEWFGLHLHPVLDLIAGLAYLTFVGIFMGVSAYLIWRIYRDVGLDWESDRKLDMARALTWSFLIVNILGYATWFAYPAAPPWYVELYGLDTVISDVTGSAARSLRFDALFGTSFFAGIYGYESNPFGAIPSLHIAYPTLSVFFAFRLGVLRTFTAAFAIVMCFSAVYFNHHYVIDVLFGAAYGVAAGFLSLLVVEKARRAGWLRPAATDVT